MREPQQFSQRCRSAQGVFRGDVPGDARLGRHPLLDPGLPLGDAHVRLLPHAPGTLTRAEIKTSTRHQQDATQVFNGADSVFRGILVPVFGLKAQLLRRDARVLAEESTKGLTEEQKAAVVASFNEGVAKKTN